ncbi:MAG TPA: hypothetical protein VGI95_04950 [Caulobacteraceae bacterium]|jgi:hypothetical protein
MIRIVALAAAVSALAIPMTASAAGADPAFDAFQSLCWNNSGEYVSTTHAADADGWRNTDVVADSDANMSITDKAAREKTTDAGRLTLLVTHGLRHMSTGDLKVNTCKVSFNKADAGVIGEASSWIGAPQDGGDNTLGAFYVKLGAGKPVHLAKADLNAAMAAGGFTILKFQQDSGDAVLVYQSYAK